MKEKEEMSESERRVELDLKKSRLKVKEWWSDNERRVE